MARMGIFFCIVFFVSTITSGISTDAEEKKSTMVVLDAPKNITVLMRTSSSIIIEWLPPKVYKPYNVSLVNGKVVVHALKMPSLGDKNSTIVDKMDKKLTEKKNESTKKPTTVEPVQKITPESKKDSFNSPTKKPEAVDKKILIENPGKDAAEDEMTAEDAVHINKAVGNKNLTEAVKKVNSSEALKTSEIQTPVEFADTSHRKEEKSGNTETNKSRRKREAQDSIDKVDCAPFILAENKSTVHLDIIDPFDIVILRFYEKTTIPPNKKAVPYDESCIKYYEVFYVETSRKDDESAVIKSQVPIYRHMLEMTGLNPSTSYTMWVSAVYKNDANNLNSTKIEINTLAKSDQPVCKCDLLGTADHKCKQNATKDNYYCQCKQGYEGQFCTRCKPGYYRTTPYFPCHKCPCENPSSTDTSCKFIKGFLKCAKCQIGYRGNICHRCDEGYYRFNRVCVNCRCNLNNDDNKCSASTGQCIGCKFNTTGPNCESCQPGYIGDPIHFKNCTLVADVKSATVAKTHKSSRRSRGMLGAIIALVVLLVCIVVGVVCYRRYRSRKRRSAFWTVEIRRGKDEFNSVGNDAAHMDDVDDLQFYDNRRGTSKSSKYSRLQEEI